MKAPEYTDFLLAAYKTPQQAATESAGIAQ